MSGTVTVTAPRLRRRSLEAVAEFPQNDGSHDQKQAAQHASIIHPERSIVKSILTQSQQWPQRTSGLGDLLKIIKDPYGYVADWSRDNISDYGIEPEAEEE